MSEAGPWPGSAQECLSQPLTWFHVFPAFRDTDAHIEQRLEKHRRVSFGSLRSEATSLSSSQWIAASTSDTVRLYQRDNRTESAKIRMQDPSIPLQHRQGNTIRAIDLAVDLLSIITENHLIVYAYKEPDFFKRPLERRIDGRWRPKAVKILQKDVDATQTNRYAWIAVGLGGMNAVNLYKYSLDSTTNRWVADDLRFILQCPGNTGSIERLEFSPDRYNEDDNFMVLGVTETSWLHCWKLPPTADEACVQPFWNFDVRCGTVTPSNQGKIVSATIFLCPLGNPYVLCCVDHKIGSSFLPSFVAPLHAPVPYRQPERQSAPPEWSPILQLENSRVMKGIVTPNGRYIVVVDGSQWSLLTLETAFEGGLAFSTTPLNWTCPLSFRSSGDASVTLTVQESGGSFEILAVDGEGLVLSTTISTPGVPEPERPALRPMQGLTETGEQSTVHRWSSGESAPSSHLSSFSIT